MDDGCVEEEFFSPETRDIGVGFRAELLTCFCRRAIFKNTEP